MRRSKPKRLKRKLKSFLTQQKSLETSLEDTVVRDGVQTRKKTMKLKRI